MSSFLVLREWDNRNRWRDGQVYPDVGQGIMAPWARRPERRGRGALPWIERTGEESSVWERTEREPWLEIT
ncbi:hypothetical protein TNCV_4941321 [Trichonephila clavipes]|nr:hypothetical protein TNCV_4941321 [Trichonephila clavipes]